MGRFYAEMVQMVGGGEKRDEKGKMGELHQHKVAQMIDSAEGSAGLLHKITKPTARRSTDLEGGGCQAVGPL